MSIYAVNGKEPVAAWIPSLDTAGNGTTTLTDLVGSADGTLTNMDAATDWVADTDAGGVRALDFDGSNDYVNFGQVLTDLHAADFTFSAWCNSAGSSTNKTIFSTSNAGSGWFIRRNDSSAADSLGLTVYHSATTAQYTSGNAAFTLGVWHHIAVVWGATSKTAKLYIDGAETESYAESIAGVGSPVTDAGKDKELARLNTTGQRYDGFIDDVRIFAETLDSADVAYLYNSGTGRGITASESTPFVDHPFSLISHPLGGF